MTGPAIPQDLGAAQDLREAEDPHSAQNVDSAQGLVPAVAVRPAALVALERAALTADAAEKRFRASFAQQVERLEVERRHAFRRYAFLKALIGADESAQDAEASRAAQLKAAAGELEWDDIDAARRPVLDALAPLMDAVHGARVASASERPKTVGDATGDEPILAALAAFEAWHLAMRGKPFENLFDRYVQETPLVDF